MIRNPSNSLNEQSKRSRYPGTRPFSDSASDYARFYGRTEEGEQLLLRVLSVPLVVQFGKSAVGKTSLLQAWLFPHLRQKPFLPVMVRLNIADEPLSNAVEHAIKQACKAEGLDLPQCRTDIGLWELLSTTTVWRDDFLLTPVLVFDQFEEVFTLRDDKFRANLAMELGAIVSGNAPERLHSGGPGSPEQFKARPNLKIVISLKEDYLGALQEFSSAIPSLFHERLRLEPLSEESARKAITEPAQLKAETGQEPFWSPGFTFEPAALDTMIDYLKGKSRVIEPFQLQLLCRYAEAIAHSKGSTQSDPIKLSLVDLKGSKSFESVLSNFYRDILRKLPYSQRKRAAVLCEEGLIDASGHRLMLHEEQIRRKFHIKAETLATLSEKRIVRRERRLESVFYEISHDRLAKSIFTSRMFKLPRSVRHRILVAGLAAIFIFVALVVWNKTIQNARVHAEEEEQKAISERKNTERLLSFLLGEKFLGEVRDIGRSSMLEQVQQQVDRHMGANEQWLELNRALALRNQGDVKLTKGFIMASAALFGQAMELFESNLENTDSQREAARTHERLGVVFYYQGQLTKALSHFQAAVMFWQQLTTNKKDCSAAKNDSTNLADSLLTIADLENRMGKTTLAIKHLEEALNIAFNVVFARQTFHYEYEAECYKAESYPDAKALEVFARAALLQANILFLPERYEAAVALVLKAKWLRPTSISTRKNAITAITRRGSSLLYKKPQSALNDYRSALIEYEELRRWDPYNRLWMRERAAAQLLLSTGIVACNKSQTKDCEPMPLLEEAEAVSLDAIATLRELAQIDLNNSSLQSDIGWALEVYAKVLAAQDRQNERLNIIEDSESVYRKSQRDEPDTEVFASLGRILIDKSDALMALERQTDALKTMQSSIEIFQRLLETNPNNLSHILDLLVAHDRKSEFLLKSGDIAGAEQSKSEKKRLESNFLSLRRNSDKEVEDLLIKIEDYITKFAELKKEGKLVAALETINSAESAIRQYIILEPTASKNYKLLYSTYKAKNSLMEGPSLDRERIAAMRALMVAAQIAVWLEPEDSENKKELIEKLFDARHRLALSLIDNLSKSLPQYQEKDFILEKAVILETLLQEEIVIAEAFLSNATKDAFYNYRLGEAKCLLGIVRKLLDKGGWEESYRSGLIHYQKATEIDTRKSKYLIVIAEARKFLAEQLYAEGQQEKAEIETELALKAEQEAATLARDDEGAVESE